MKKTYFLFLLACITLCGCSNASESISPGNKQSSAKSFSFNKENYPVITNIDSGDAMYVPNVAELERIMMEQLDGKTFGMIAECTVIGESINHIVEPPLAEREAGVVYGTNHVLTPVRIDKILYAGTAVDVDSGTEFLLIEPYFYITDETPDYQEMYNTSFACAAGDYNPVVKEKRYLIFLRLATWYPKKSYAYPATEGTLFFQPMYRNFAVYGLGSKESVKKDLVTSTDAFWKSWEQVMQIYGSYKSDELLPTPLIYKKM